MTDTSPDRGSTTPLPLSGVRILDTAEGQFQMIGRYFADLGADVLRVEPPEGSADRHRGVTDHGVSLTFEIANANKRSVTVDPSAPSAAAELDGLAAGADIVLVDRRSAYAAALDADRLTADRQELVVTVLSDFGELSSKRDWAATPDVQFALSTILSRSGLPDRAEPLLPPEFLVAGAVAPQAVWQTVTAYYNARRTDTGDVIDFSALDALLHIFDPPMGMQGSGRTGTDPFDVPHGRPDARYLYPIFDTTDGKVRICVLSKRQWASMFRWLGEPAELARPELALNPVRQEAWPELFPYYERLFGAMTTEEAVRRGDELRVPVTSIDALSDVVNEPAFWDGGDFAGLALPDGRTATSPAGVYSIDGRHVGLRTAAPGVGEPAAAGTAWASDRAQDPVLPGRAGGWVTPADANPRRPFEGLRVLDFGVIVMGAEAGRLFADYGADVIKVESMAFRDGCRQMKDGVEMSQSFAWGHRNKRSLGLDLTTDAGKRVFRQLVAETDVILTNFKPGTLAKLGFSYEVLADINPGIVLSESSAYGNDGPWSRKMGYGPLVRAASGLSQLWSYAGDADGYSDTITIYPDHVVARLNAVAVTGLLLRRAGTGRGGVVSTAQIDAIFTAMGPYLAAESLEPGSGVAALTAAQDAPAGLYQAAGDDEWVVIDGVGDDRFRALAAVVGHPEWASDSRFATAADRLAHADELDAPLAAWVAGQPAPEVERQLQDAGVPAGHMVRFGEVQTDPDLIRRGLLTTMDQQDVDGPLPTMANEGRTRRLGDARVNQAPLQGEHTREIMHEILHLDDSTIDALLGDGALEQNPRTDPARSADNEGAVAR
jgi:crotonobetainyl-CoA:carnitine CoA-transferase CaiB-like acyl-CoA transferase